MKTKRNKKGFDFTWGVMLGIIIGIIILVVILMGIFGTSGALFSGSEGIVSGP